MFCCIALNAFCVLRALDVSELIAQAKHLLVRTCSSVSLGLDSARSDVRIARRPLNTAGKFEGLHSEGSDSCRAGKRCKTWSS